MGIQAQWTAAEPHGTPNGGAPPNTSLLFRFRPPRILPPPARPVLNVSLVSKRRRVGGGEGAGRKIGRQEQRHPTEQRELRPQIHLLSLLRPSLFPFSPGRFHPTNTAFRRSRNFGFWSGAEDKGRRKTQMRRLAQWATTPRNTKRMESRPKIHFYSAPLSFFSFRDFHLPSDQSIGFGGLETMGLGRMGRR